MQHCIASILTYLPTHIMLNIINTFCKFQNLGIEQIKYIYNIYSLIFFQDYHSDNLVQNSRTANSLSSYDIKKPLGGLISSSDLSSVSHHHHPGAHAHAFSHYSQMGMSAAAAKTHSHIMGGGTVVPGGGGGGMTPPTAGSHPAVATHRSPITDFFGKMMSFSSCHQTPVLPSYYQNSMYSTDKIDSHL